MVPVKIECGCGQHYAFEVEPSAGHMLVPVACPACGADGTASANQQIAHGPPATNRITLHPTRNEAAAQATAQETSAGARNASHASQMGIADHDKAEVEARAKISWGDSAEDVIKYLMIQGFEYSEAAKLVQELAQERTAVTRGNGIKRVGIGIAMAFVPIIALINLNRLNPLTLRLSGITLIIGAWGFWKIITGTLMIVAPKMEKGDVADQ